ncbi:hypothetical protein J6590_091314 [Homalodisca vitripennis]|nr:hypothetical protein J6590_091314 [Homalodisca vitripennis]
MTSPTRSPFSNPFKIRRRGSIILSAGGVLDTRCCPHSTPIHEQFHTSGDPGLPAALAEDLDDPVLRDSPQGTSPVAFISAIPRLRLFLKDRTASEIQENLKPNI